MDHKCVVCDGVNRDAEFVANEIESLEEECSEKYPELGLKERRLWILKELWALGAIDFSDGYERICLQEQNNHLRTQIEILSQKAPDDLSQLSLYFPPFNSEDAWELRFPELPEQSESDEIQVSVIGYSLAHKKFRLQEWRTIFRIVPHTKTSNEFAKQLDNAIRTIENPFKLEDAAWVFISDVILTKREQIKNFRLFLTVVCSYLRASEHIDLATRLATSFETAYQISL